MRRLAQNLQEIEEDTPLQGSRLRGLVESTNAWRLDHGISPLDVGSDEEDPPELELYRRAKALGMVPTSN